MQPDYSVPDHPGISELLARVRQDGQRMVDAEIARVRTLVGGYLANAKGAAIFLGAAAVLALGAVGALLVGLILTLATLVGPGWATLLVVVAALAIAGLLGWIGARRIGGLVATQRVDAEAQAARGTLTRSLGTLRDNLAPAALARSASESLAANGNRIAEAGTDAVRSNPGKVAAVAAGVGLFFARHAILRRFRGGEEAPPPTTQPPKTRRVEPTRRKRGTA